MIHCVYQIKDIRNDEVIYIGITDNFERRKQQHFNISYWSGLTNKELYRYIAQEGIKNFDMTIIYACDDREEIRKLETHYVNSYPEGQLKNMEIGVAGVRNSTELYVYNLETGEEFFFKSLGEAATFLNVRFTTVRKALLKKYLINNLFIVSETNNWETVKLDFFSIVGENGDFYTPGFRTLSEAAKWAIDVGLSSNSFSTTLNKISKACKDNSEVYGYK